MLDPFNINSNFADSFSFQHDQDIQPDLYVLRQGKVQKQRQKQPHLSFEEHSNSSKKKYVMIVVVMMITGQVMGHPSTEPILPGQMRNVAIAFTLLIGILFHLLLSYLGY